MPSRTVIASALFFLLGPGLEAGLGPWLLTGGWRRGESLPAQGLWTLMGLLLVLAGLATVIEAFVRLTTDGRGTPTPAVATERLVVSGAYRHVRNPIYLATAVMIAGEGLALARPLLPLAAAAYLLTLAAATRRWEEPSLRQRFGPSYDTYRAAVPGWWPRRRPWSP